MDARRDFGGGKAALGQQLSLRPQRRQAAESDGTAAQPTARHARFSRCRHSVEAGGVAVHSLAVKSTTLDDVFVHYTGHDLRDALQDPAPRQFPGFRR